MIVAGYDILAKLRVEHSDLFNRDVEHLGYLIEVHAFVYQHCIGNQLLLHNCRSYAILTVIIHHEISCNECRHISAGFWQKEVVNFPIIFLAGASCASQRLVDITGSAVIGGYGQRPILIDLIQLLEISHRIARCKARIATLVNERIHLKSQTHSCGWHHLPESACAHTRHSVGIQRRLDDRQILQLKRKLLSQQLFYEYVAVIIVESKQISHKITTLSEIHVDIIAHNGIIWQFYLRRQLAQQLLVFGRIAFDRRRGRFVGTRSVMLEIEIFLQFTGFGFKTLRRDDIVVGDRMLDVENGQPFSRCGEREQSGK